MKHIITKILYRSVFSDGGWYRLDYLSGYGTLEIEDKDTENGMLRTYRLEVPVKRVIRDGEASLVADLQLIVNYDIALEARIGNKDRPVRLNILQIDYPLVSCEWQEPVER